LNGSLKVQSTTTSKGSVENIGFWDHERDTASWRVHFNAPGSYRASALAATASGATEVAVDAGSGASTTLAVPQTEGWDQFQTVTGGLLRIDAAGDRTITVRAADLAAWHAVNLASITLAKAP
jgi:hypothetical protein